MAEGKPKSTPHKKKKGLAEIWWLPREPLHGVEPTGKFANARAAPGTSNATKWQAVKGLYDA
jgi:hypothetical protein